tara:strand:- start:4448 stop:4780 length:333 start_codon:yes stop_codon:yes gene_type:complete
MGNTVSSPKYKDLNNEEDEYKYVSYEEVALEDDMKKYAVSGETKTEALENLELFCRSRGMPKLEKGRKYYCGTVRILKMFRFETKYNTVFFSERNGRHLAIIFYYNNCRI